MPKSTLKRLTVSDGDRHELQQLINRHNTLLKRASFLSKDDLKNRILSFIEYFNKTMAKPLKWTYKGKVLAV